MIVKQCGIGIYIYIYTQCNRELRNKPHIFGQIIFASMPKPWYRERTAFSTNGAGET